MDAGGQAANAERKLLQRYEFARPVRGGHIAWAKHHHFLRRDMSCLGAERNHCRGVPGKFR